MSIALDILNQTDQEIEFEKDFKRIFKETLKQTNNKGDFEVSLTFIDDTKIHEFNKQFRNIDRPTDVLSFAFNEADVIKISGMPTILGDIFISIETAKRQAEEYAHSLRREICFLFCHGLLHLLGYDHMKEEDEKVMFGLQETILSALDIRR